MFFVGQRKENTMNYQNFDSILRIFLYAVVTFIMVHLTGAVFKKIEKHTDAVHIHFFNSVINVIIVSVMCYTCISSFPETQKISSMILKSGSIALALITFVAQKSLGNIIGGFSVSLSKAYHIGDKIQINDSGAILDGAVVGMTFRHTLIKTYDNKMHIIPNSIMDNTVITNVDYTDGASCIFEFDIANDNDKNTKYKAKKIIMDALLSDNSIINKNEIVILINNVTENSVKLKTSAIMVDNLDTLYIMKDRVYERVLDEFSDNNISFPVNKISIQK